MTNKDSSEDERDLLQSDETGSVNSLTQPLLRSGTESVPSSHGSKNKLNESLFGEQNKKIAKACIMLTVVLERAAYYGLVGNLAYFANAFLDYTSTESITVALVFSGMTWLSCFTGGVFGDAVFGRFKTILVGLVCYVLGYVSLATLGHVTEHNDDSIKGKGREPLYVVWFTLSLLFISLGEGCFKANMSTFGADQVDTTQQCEMRTFFNYFYWSINIGSFIGFSLLAWIQQRYNFCTGYIVPCVLLFLAILIFVIPRRRNYHVQSPKHNVLRIVKICWYAMKKRRTTKTNFETFNPMQSRLDRAKVKYGGDFLDKEVDDVKILVSLLPVLGFLIIYCSCYFQINSMFVIQGIHMHIPSLDKNNIIPVAWFQLFNVVVVLLFVPIIDKFVYPALDKYFTRHPYVSRIAIGMFLASGSMIAAGLVEMDRLHAPGNCTNHLNNQNKMSLTSKCKEVEIWLQIPQYFCLGISEIFVLITGLEFAYCQSPKSMQSFVTSLFFVVNGLGSILASVILVLGNAAKLRFIYPENPPDAGKPLPDLEGHLHYFFFFMAALNFVNCIGFVWFSIRRHKNEGKQRKQIMPTFLPDQSASPPK